MLLRRCATRRGSSFFPSRPTATLVPRDIRRRYCICLFTVLLRKDDRLAEDRAGPVNTGLTFTAGFVVSGRWVELGPVPAEGGRSMPEAILKSFSSNFTLICHSFSSCPSEGGIRLHRVRSSLTSLSRSSVSRGACMLTKDNMYSHSSWLITTSI